MRWRLFAAGAGAYAIALVITAPATLVDAGLRDVSDGRLRLCEAQGTLWSGAGQLEIFDAGRRGGITKSIVWRLQAASLLRGHLVYEVELDLAAKAFPVTLSLSRVEVADADIKLPAGVLGLAVPRLAPLGLAGDVQIHVANLSVARDSVDGHATLQWRAAGSALTPVSPLGEYAMDFNAVGSGVHAVLRTLKGPLQINGKGEWSQGTAPSFFASASVPASLQDQLAPFLNLIAIEKGAGSFEISSNHMAF
jgi:general secretion pathway protein N